MENVFTNINNIYNKKGFLERYGSDIWITAFILITFFVVTSYFYVMNHIKPILADWDNSKCSPNIIPFAGLINKDPKMTAFEFTSKNFTGCLHTILKNITADAFAPVYYLMKTFTTEFENLAKAVDSIRNMVNKIRITIKKFSEDVMSRLLNVTMPILQFVINMKDMLGKINGTLTATTYTLMGSYLSLQSLFANIINFIIIILVALGATIVGLLFIPFVGEVIAMPFIATMIAILIPTIIIQTFMGDIFKMPTRSPPSVPGCFSENTIMTKIENETELIKIKISDIKIGDILFDYSSVTGVIKFSAKDQQVYDLYGVNVTGEHRVHYYKLGWIKVKEHPDSFEIHNFNEPYVYCLMTSNKIFKINDIVYSDWDDIDETVFNKLEENCPFIPNNLKNMDIHYYLDNGLHGDTNIPMKDGYFKKLEDIEVNDILQDGIVVLGKVKIDAIDINGIYEYNFNNIIYNNSTVKNMKIQICGKNVEIIDTYLGSLNTRDIKKHDILLKPQELNNIKYLYQLITNTGDFILTNNIKIKDYNYGIDKYIQ